MTNPVETALDAGLAWVRARAGREGVVVIAVSMLIVESVGMIGVIEGMAGARPGSVVAACSLVMCVHGLALVSGELWRNLRSG